MVYYSAGIYTVPTDVLYNADGAVFNDYFNFAHPMPVFDRFKFPFEPEIGTNYSTGISGYGITDYGEREQFYEPVQVYFKAVNYNTTTRELKVTLGAYFFDNLSGDYRFNLYLMEDGIIGYQADAPDPNNYTHNHVLRAMLGGTWGVQSSLPATIAKNDAREYTFTYTVPTNYKTDNMHLIAMVETYNADALNRRILNSEYKTFNQALSINSTPGATDSKISVYPNPTKDKLHISFRDQHQTYTVRLADIAGKVYTTLQCTGDAEINIQSLAPGTYILYADDGQVVHTQTVVQE